MNFSTALSLRLTCCLKLS